MQTLLRRPEPCPQPEVVEETRPLKAPRLHAPKLRAVADFRPTDAQAERQAALTKWDQVVRLLPRLFDPTVLSQLHNEDFAVELGNLDLIFSKKSTSTLTSRASGQLHAAFLQLDTEDVCRRGGFRTNPVSVLPETPQREERHLRTGSVAPGPQLLRRNSGAFCPSDRSQVSQGHRAGSPVPEGAGVYKASPTSD